MPTHSRQASTTMKVTTVRFGTDLWQLLEAESARSGVSVSQYIREAALARAAAAAARRGSAPFDLLAGGVREVLPFHPDPSTRLEAERALATLARITADQTATEAEAVRGENEQARRRATDVGRKIAPRRARRS